MTVVQLPYNNHNNNNKRYKDDRTCKSGYDSKGLNTKCKLLNSFRKFLMKI